MAVPKVNSPLLAEAVEVAGPKISDFTTTLDGVSQDIRTLEKMLQDSGFRLTVITEINNYEAVAWTDLNRKWRIYYREGSSILTILMAILGGGITDR